MQKSVVAQFNHAQKKMGERPWVSQHSGGCWKSTFLRSAFVLTKRTTVTPAKLLELTAVDVCFPKKDQVVWTLFRGDTEATQERLN